MNYKSRFKVGDTVTCISTHRMAKPCEMVLGNRYKIVSVFTEFFWSDTPMLELEGARGTWSEDQFGPAKLSNEDRVKLRMSEIKN